MNGIVACKMTGSGNDFVFVDGRTTALEFWTPERIRAACNRRDGVGADGFGILEPGATPDHIRFHFFNSDGGRAPMCGNGALCATRLSRWFELAQNDDMVLETDAGLVRTRVLPDNDHLAEFELESVGQFSTPEIERTSGEHSITFTRVAVPHLVVVVEDADSVPLEMRGRELRNHQALAPEGANVNFVSRNGAALRVRTYERGVEGETLACATGSVACAAVVAKELQLQMPQEIITTSGRTLTVSGKMTPDFHIESPRLRGEARRVFRAILQPQLFQIG